MNPQTIARQTRFRQFVYDFDMNPIIEKTDLRTALKTGLSIVFVENQAQADTIRQMCDGMYVPVGAYNRWPASQAQLLNAWHKLTLKHSFGVMILHQSACTGWYAYADKIIWIGEQYDANTPEFAQASLRIRGKTVTPVIYSKEELS